MIKTPSLHPLPLRQWMLSVLVGAAVLGSLYFLAASTWMLIARDSERQPGVPPKPSVRTSEPDAPATARNPQPSATPSASPTAVPSASPTAVLTFTPIPKPGTVRKIEPGGLAVVYIPKGKYEMGGRTTGSNNLPRHKVVLSAYWISRTQVTNAQYAKCVSAGGCTRPIRKALNPHYYDKAYAKHPAVYITWEQAQAFCQWAGGDLPTEAQWEIAASGGKRTYPWGERDEPNPNVAEPEGGTVAVGSRPGDASPYGVLDLGSNVREWVRDWYRPGYPRSATPLVDPTGPAKGEKRVLRGAAWHDPEEFSTVWHRLAHVPGSPGANRGFRCAFAP